MRLKDFYIIAHPKVKWENLLFSVALMIKNPPATAGDNMDDSQMLYAM